MTAKLLGFEQPFQADNSNKNYNALQHLHRNLILVNNHNFSVEYTLFVVGIVVLVLEVRSFVNHCSYLNRYAGVRILNIKLYKMGGGVGHAVAY